ncbi:MAG TPA: hypothetical protein VM848_00880 [Acidimicrobiia bacterium]|nr:hypothetical protein [Acidimicrobiia bacterium]
MEIVVDDRGHHYGVVTAEDAHRLGQRPGCGLFDDVREDEDERALGACHKLKREGVVGLLVSRFQIEDRPYNGLSPGTPRRGSG